MTMAVVATGVIFSVLFLAGSEAVTRRYYIAARDVLWDYSPGGGVFRTVEEQTFADNYILPRDNRIGNIYKKVGYFQFTDDTFSVEVPKPHYLGLMGPVIRGELDDLIEVHFYNNASRNYSIHPHGVFYKKNHESALYLDNTTGIDKLDDNVPPGGKVSLEWFINENNAPTHADPACLPWLYHSHVNAVKDVATGAIGFLVTCKKGVLNEKNERSDADREFPLIFFNWDENLNWYLEENIATYCQNPVLCKQLSESSDPYFIDSNVKRSINALAFSTLPGLEACVGEKVQFYVIGFGNEKDIHAVHFHGQNIKYQRVRGDTVFVYSATFVAAETTPKNVGKWLITDMVGDHEKAGSSAFYHVKNCDNGRQEPQTHYEMTRKYFLAIEKVLWSYSEPEPTPETLTTESPQIKDYGNGLARRKRAYSYDRYKNEFLSWYRVRSWSWPKLSNATATNGTSYTKAKFVQYINGAYDAKVPPLARYAHMGILGPVLRAEVGDRLLVTLKNKIPFNVSFLPHGLKYDVIQEAREGEGVVGGAVRPGEVYTYTFYVPTTLLDDYHDQCKVFLYTSGHNPRKDQNTGLVGPLLICKKPVSLTFEPAPKQFFLLLSIIDETKSMYSNATLDIGSPVSDLKFTINGYTKGQLPGLDICFNETVKWHVMSVGTELDVHTVTFDGNVFMEDGKNRDGRHLVPGDTATLTMRPDSTGKWMVYSQSNFARENGMFAYYNVNECKARNADGYSELTGANREYFIAAEESLWDYAPLQRTIVTGDNLNDPNTEGSIFVRHDENFIGRIYKKALFKEYTDGTFDTLKPTEDRDILGPVMWAEVGDTLKVNFKNKASRPYSIYTHGLRKSQSNSGVDYGSSKGVAPGDTQQYVWQVPARAGPGPNDPNCVPWLYYSSVDPVKDTNSGLVGALVVCRRGILNSESKRKDVERELFIYMTVMNENESWYLDENVKNFAPGRVGTDYRNDDLFSESNRKHSTNGRLYGNNNGFILEYGTRSVLYMMSLGAEIDLHTMHLHGHTFIHTSEKHRDDVISMFPGMAEAVELIADNPGTWLVHCHVMDHIFAGMETTYTVLKQGETVKSYLESLHQ